MRKPTPGLAWTAALLAAAAFGGVGVSGAAAARSATARAARLSIASPATGNLVAGLVPVAVAFDAGTAGRVTAIELWVNDRLYNSQTLEDADPRGTYTIDWDTEPLRNGQHSLQVRAYSGRKVVATDAVVVSVSNGGVDVVPPLISFYAPLDGQIVSGDVNIGVHATDNDQVALVGLFVNRQLKMMKSHPPFQYTLDTTTLPLLNGRGALVLEAWAYDRAQNRGLARAITVYVQNRINATPMQPDPKAPKGAAGGQGDAAKGSDDSPSPEPAVTKPPAKVVARLSPLEALAPVRTPAATAGGRPEAAPLKTPTPSAALAPRPAASLPEGKLSPAPNPRLDVALAPKPSPERSTIIPPAPGQPSRGATVVPPRPSEAQLDVTLRAVPIAPPKAASLRPEAPTGRPAPGPVKPAVKPDPVTLRPLELARLPEGALVAVPRPADPELVPPQAARPATETRTEVPPRAAARKVATPKRSRPTAVKRTARATLSPPKPAAPPQGARLQPGSTPDRVVLPVYRLARLPENGVARPIYTVQRGDTLGQIARRHRVTPRSILVANGLTRAADLKAGRQLTIPGTFQIAVNDQPVGFDVQPRVEGGMAIAPFRQIFEHTGGIVRYHAPEREVEAKNPEKEIRLKIGSREALVNSAVVLMDREAFLDSGRTMVPVKFMTEALDMKAEYDLKTGAIYLIKK